MQIISRSFSLGAFHFANNIMVYLNVNLQISISIFTCAIYFQFRERCVTCSFWTDKIFIFNSKDNHEFTKAKDFVLVITMANFSQTIDDGFVIWWNWFSIIVFFSSRTWRVCRQYLMSETQLWLQTLDSSTFEIAWLHTKFVNISKFQYNNWKLYGEKTYMDGEKYMHVLLDIR